MCSVESMPYKFKKAECPITDLGSASSFFNFLLIAWPKRLKDTIDTAIKQLK